MSFVGTRPEVTKYVKKYTKEMRATLLLPAGITSEASIQYKDEAELLDAADDVDRVYVEKVLPEKMKSHTSLVAQQTRLSEWADLIRDCQNRPQGMKIDEWCQLHSITKV